MRSGVQKFRQAFNVLTSICDGMPTEQILIFLELAEYGELTQIELSDRLGITPPTLSRHLKRLNCCLPGPPSKPGTINLKKYGLIDKRYDAENPRTLTVFLTEDGEEIRKQIEDLIK